MDILSVYIINGADEDIFCAILRESLCRSDMERMLISIESTLIRIKSGYFPGSVSSENLELYRYANEDNALLCFNDVKIGLSYDLGFGIPTLVHTLSNVSVKGFVGNYGEKMGIITSGVFKEKIVSYVPDSPFGMYFMLSNIRE